MGDNLTPEQRRYTMASVRSKDTKPEIKVRRLVHGLGYRYRLHRKELPGNPDLVFPSRKKVIFVHGCFWHGHKNCPAAKRPLSNQDYWLPKLDRNKKRDQAHADKLRKLGWGILTVWECQTKDEKKLETTIKNFLGKRKNE